MHRSTFPDDFMNDCNMTEALTPTCWCAVFRTVVYTYLTHSIVTRLRAGRPGRPGFYYR